MVFVAIFMWMGWVDRARASRDGSFHPAMDPTCSSAGVMPKGAGDPWTLTDYGSI